MSCVYFGSEYRISKDQELYEFFSKHFRQRCLSSTQKRLFRTDFTDILKTIATSADNAPDFLMCIGILVLSDRCVGIRKKVLSSFICYKPCVIRNAIKLMHWTNISPSHNLCPDFVQKLTSLRQWSFYSLPKDCSVSQIIVSNPSLISKGDAPTPKLHVTRNPMRNLLLSFC